MRECRCEECSGYCQACLEQEEQYNLGQDKPDQALEDSYWNEVFFSGSWNESF